MGLTCPDKQLRYELGKLMYQDLGSVLNTCRIHEQIMKDIENKTKTSINSTTIAQEQEEITANLAYSKQYQQNNNRFQYNNQKQQFNQANKSAQNQPYFQRNDSVRRFDNSNGCGFCTKSHPGQRCPALGHRCSICGRLDHAEEKCFGKNWAPRPRAQSARQINSNLYETSKRFRSSPPKSGKKAKRSRSKFKKRTSSRKKGKHIKNKSSSSSSESESSSSSSSASSDSQVLRHQSNQGIGIRVAMLF